MFAFYWKINRINYIPVDSNRKRIVSVFFFRSEDIYWTSSKNKKLALRHKNTHYITTTAARHILCQIHFVHFIRYLEKLMRYFNSQKWSELCLSRRFQRCTTFRDILENNFGLLLKTIRKKTALSQLIPTVKGLWLYVIPFWRYWTSSRKKNALRHKNTQYVINDACSAYFILNFFRTVSTISRKVDEISQFWKVIWSLLINVL